MSIIKNINNSQFKHYSFLNLPLPLFSHRWLIPRSFNWHVFLGRFSVVKDSNDSELKHHTSDNFLLSFGGQGWNVLGISSALIPFITIRES